MLQQTQIATVIPYFERWMARFPDIASLAAADDAEALALWQGLGYYRRCHLLLAGVRWVAEHGIPQDAASWRAVPGVGPYTAGAIASIAQSQRAALVDGNVKRVFARMKGSRATGPTLQKAAWTWAEAMLDPAEPGDWNQALMELGATLCAPQSPHCPRCPVKGWCFAFETGTQGELPVPVARQKPVSLRHACWVAYCDGQFGVRQIGPTKWWPNMWEFPRIDYVPPDEPVPPLESLRNVWLEELELIRHHVTHHRIELRVFLAQLERPDEALRWESPAALRGLPMPAPQRKALRMAMKQLGL
jgi:A/G-specific adenine glycosylase